jgi:hypothetical protein
MAAGCPRGAPAIRYYPLSPVDLRLYYGLESCSNVICNCLTLHYRLSNARVNFFP